VGKRASRCVSVRAAGCCMRRAQQEASIPVSEWPRLVVQTEMVPAWHWGHMCE
jgi:hypothetical protein